MLSVAKFEPGKAYDSCMQEVTFGASKCIFVVYIITVYSLFVDKERDYDNLEARCCMGVCIFYMGRWLDKFLN